MGLEYNLLKPSEPSIQERIRTLQKVLAPRNQCEHYTLTRAEGRATLMTKKDFDGHREEDFSDGPFKDSFGDGYGDPYNPHRQAFGKLMSGTVIYCELSKANRKLTDELLRLIEQES